MKTKPYAFSFIYRVGGIAQLGERLNGIQEVGNSILLISTKVQRSPNDNTASFQANVDIKVSDYETVPFKMMLIETISCSKDEIEGYFHVIYNKVKNKRIKGTIYGLGQKEYDIYKIRTEEYNYNFVANIDNFAVKKPESHIIETQPQNIASISVFFRSPMYFKTPDMQNMITPDNGTASYSWRIDKTESTLKAEYKIGDNTCSFVSDQVISTNNEGFEGYFDVAKNGEVIEKSIKGKVYGIENMSGVYPYFKFYSEDAKWHFSGQMTEITKK